jgi:hypothetical protein
MIPLVSLAAVAASWVFFAGVERHFLNPPIVARDLRSPPTADGPLAGETPVPAGPAASPAPAPDAGRSRIAGRA